MFKDWRDASLLDWVIGAVVVLVIVFLFSGAARADIFQCDEVASNNSQFDKQVVNSIFSDAMFPMGLRLRSSLSVIVVCKTKSTFTPSALRYYTSESYGVYQSYSQASCSYSTAVNGCVVNVNNVVLATRLSSRYFPFSISIAGLTRDTINSYVGTNAGVLRILNDVVADSSIPKYLVVSGGVGGTSFYGMNVLISGCAVYNATTCRSKSLSSLAFHGVGVFDRYSSGILINVNGTSYMDTGSALSTTRINSSSYDYYVVTFSFNVNMVGSISSYGFEDYIDFGMRFGLDGAYGSICNVDCSSVADSGSPVCAAGASSAAGCGLVQPVSDETPFPEIIKGGAYTTSEALAYLRRVCVDVTVDACRAALSKYHDYKWSMPDWFVGADVFYQERYQ